MKIINNFITNKQSNLLLYYHIQNFNLNLDHSFMHRNTEVMACSKVMYNSIIKEMHDKLEKFGKSVNKKYTINYFQIVKWPTGESQDRHIDFEYHPFTSILYLNDDFVGGETVVGKKSFKPIKNTIIGFEGNKIKHEVKKIRKGVRYTIPCWYKYEGVTIN